MHEAAGTRTPELHLNPDVWGVGRPRHEFVDRTARQMGLSPDDLDRSAYVLACSVQQIVDYLGLLRERVGISYVTIPSDQMTNSPKSSTAWVADKLSRAVERRL